MWTGVPSNECSEEILVSLIFMERVDEVHSGGVVPCGLSKKLEGY